MKSPNTHKGAALLIILFSIMFLIIAGRFLYIETTAEVEGVNLQEWAENTRTTSYQLDANRGKIYDKNGMVLAYDRPTYRLHAIVDPSFTTNEADPKHVDDIEETASKLAPLIDMNEAEMAETMKEAKEDGRFQIEFGNKGRDLSQAKMKEIKELELSGIGFDQESKRYYPNGKFASHIIGFARTEDGHINGVTGVEKQMEEYLEGEKGKISYKRDKYGTKLLDPEEILKPPDDGENVHLTLDQKIQTFLEDAMSSVEEQYKPKKIMAAVMDPDTGEILAMSNRPSYNPNDIGDVENWYNDVISNPFEPGSTMKMFTWAAAIEEGVYNGKDKFKSGSYKVGEDYPPIYDHKPEGWGKITFNEGFRRSSNVAASILAMEKLGPDKFREYLSAFRLDQKTGIDLPGEASGKILYDYPIEKVTTSFGQGTTTTPIQLMTAATSIANGGKIMKPYVLSKITGSDSDKAVKVSEPEVLGKPISEHTAKKMRDLLGSVVTGEDGTGAPYKLGDYSVAGKTGTAQIPGPDGAYLTGRENYTFSFLGMAPKEDPELLMYVAVQQPELEPTEAGSAPVSYIFNTVMENSLHYLDINPDKSNDQQVDADQLKDVTDMKTKEAVDTLKKTYDHVSVVGNGGKVTATLPNAGTSILSGQRVIVVTDQPKMPDITGWALRDVQRLAEHFNLKMETMGSGYVVKQSIAKGSKLKDDGYLVVELSPPQ
ncbi:penicillin-binding protein [Halobacillus amylolyticus]|uniref:serine-type D-Ala-D-Ala carboxypeptidase n=1 Tax=Halobacillus amylolyticus TaxID=2932259 RepID=A0ABY4HEU0_9BACI|nr:penicillin-binding protein [Halobacillus amylolyticus]UOR12927.1 penicillin-binding protein [Halobacillus amylolyticus]